MKQILFFMILALGVVSCKGVGEVTLPDKSIKVSNDIVTYKDAPYSGKIRMNLVDKIQGYEGFLTFKEGHLDGVSDIKNENKKQHMKFTIVNGKFDGNIIMNDPEQSIKMDLDINKGVITKMIADVYNTYKYDLTFNKGLANGTMEAEGQKFTFKDGIAKIPGAPEGAELKLSMDEATGDMIMENVMNGKSVRQQKIPNQLTPQYLEKVLFVSIQMVNR